MTESSRRTDTSGRSNARTSKERKGRSRRNDRARRREATHSGERTDARGHPVERLHRQYGNQAVQRLATRQESVTGARRPGDDRRIDRVVDVLDGRKGRPLPADTRRVMGRRFGHDFRSVRVYDDAEAANSARSLGAAAYTVGSDIVFGPGRFDPGTLEGRLLLAHELAHVVQRERARGATRGDRVVNSPGEESEVSANQAAARVVTGDSVHVGAIPGTAVVQAQSDDWLSGLGTANNLLGYQQAWLSSLADASLHGHRASLAGSGFRWSPAGALVSSADESMGLARLSSDFTFAGSGARNLSRLGKVAGGIGVGLGAYNMYQATNTADRVQAGADTLASGIGFAGPLGTSFSGGYAAGQLIDQGVGWLGGATTGDDRTASDRLGDAMFESLGPAPDWMLDMF